MLADLPTSAESISIETRSSALEPTTAAKGPSSLDNNADNMLARHTTTAVSSTEAKAPTETKSTTLEEEISPMVVKSLSRTAIAPTKRPQKTLDALDHCVFTFSAGALKERSHEELKTIIKALGGSFISSLTKNVTHFVLMPEEIERPADKIRRALCRDDVISVSSAYIFACQEQNAKVDPIPFQMKWSETVPAAMNRDRDTTNENEEDREPDLTTPRKRARSSSRSTNSETPDSERSFRIGTNSRCTTEDNLDAKTTLSRRGRKPKSLTTGETSPSTMITETAKATCSIDLDVPAHVETTLVAVESMKEEAVSTIATYGEDKENARVIQEEAPSTIKDKQV